MTPEQWHRVKEVFEAALECDSSQRAAFLDEACDGDVALRREAESLIESYEKEQSFMSLPVIAAGPFLLDKQAESLVGQMVGHYKILAPIGAGGMGEVYLSLDIRLGRQVALKLLPTYLSGDSDRLRRFEQEARAASSLNHPNVCMIHEVGEMDDGRHYIVMEHIEGVTLREHLAIKPLKLREVLDAAVQIASALEVAHAAGVVHRDIKPENIMLRRDGYLKVLDFGLAKLTEKLSERQRVEPEAPTRGMVKTDVGVVMGTVAYMSPEQTRGQDIDARTDIWSLGVVLYELVTGRVPFEGATNSDLIVSILEREPKPLTWLLPNAPAEFQRIISKALRKDREERYQGIKDLLLDLKSLKQELDFEAKLEQSVQPEFSGKATKKSDGQLAVKITEETAARTSPLPAARPTSSAEYLVSEIKRHKRGAMLALGALVVVAAGIAYLAPWIYQIPKTDQQSPQHSLVRLTFDAGLQSDPTWSPDGRFIAYSSDRSGNFDIWVQPVGGGDAAQVTHSPAHEWQPDWSPDGSQIVFRSARDDGGLFVVPALGGREKRVSSFGYQPRWSPDGSKILFINWDMEGKDLAPFAPQVYLVALDGGPPRQVLAEPLAKFYSIYAVGWHPDGRRVSIWGRQMQQWSSATLDLPLSFWTVPLEVGRPVKSELTSGVEDQVKDAAVTFRNFRWAPSGNALYFEGVSRDARNLWKVTVDPLTLRWTAGPQRLTTAALSSDTNIALSPDGKRLAFTTRLESTRIWSLPFDARTGKVKGEGQPVTAAGMNAFDPALSPDGKKLVFNGQRPGTHKSEMWEKSLEDGRETLLAADEFRRMGPSWSQDAKHLVYNRVQFTNWERTEFKITRCLMPAGGGEEQVLSFTGTLSEFPNDSSADGYWLAGSCLKSLSPEDRVVICLFPVSATHGETEPRVLVSDPDYRFWGAHFSPDERWICFNAEKFREPTISIIGVVSRLGGEWKRLTEEKYWADKPRWSPDGKTLYFISNHRTAFFNVWGMRFDPVDGKATSEPFQVTSFESPGKMISPQIVDTQISLSKDRLLVPIREVTGSIWMLENVDR